jgi:large subunit ribosomal protein L15
MRGLGNSNTAFRDNYAIVNIAELEAFEANSQVTPETLAEQKLITATESRGLLKILGNGEVDRVLTIRAHKVSAGARAKIEAAGGTVELIPVKVYEKTKRRKDEKPATTPAAPAQDTNA